MLGLRHLLAGAVPQPIAPLIFNLGTGTAYSVQEVLTVAQEVTQRPLTAVVSPRRPGDPPTLVASAQKAREVLGWEPRYPDLGEIIAHAWAWHQRTGPTP